ncbi:MAG TPA: uracil-DNA glycosylase [Symbiobacteriaceae bacterium]|nr:uracil-DNA glycosylase [Symbiobacteriaceae bacterium]
MEEWILLSEVPPPGAATDCRRCPLALQRSRVIWGEGNPQAPILVVLDNPGAREDAAGESFVCGTRQTLQTCVREAGLSLDDLYVTWVLKCRPRRAYDKEAARAACLPYLGEQLAEAPRKVVVPLGNVALQAYLGDPAAEVKALRGRVLQHKGQQVVCGYHPLAVRRRPNLLPLLVADLRLAGAAASGLQG